MSRREVFAWLALGFVLGFLVALYLTRNNTPPDANITQAEWRRPMATRRGA